MRKLESNVGYKSLYRKKKEGKLKDGTNYKINWNSNRFFDWRKLRGRWFESQSRQTITSTRNLSKLDKNLPKQRKLWQISKKKIFFLVTVVGIWLLAQREKKSNSKVIQSITAIAIGQNDGRLLRVWPWMIAVKTAMATLLIALSLGNVTGHCENWWPSR